jgi:hypothetical protein
MTVAGQLNLLLLFKKNVVFHRNPSILRLDVSDGGSACGKAVVSNVHRTTEKLVENPGPWTRF